MKQESKKPIRAIITLYDKDVIIKRVVYEYVDGSFSDSVEHDLTNEDVAEEIKKFVYANFQLKDRKNRVSPNALDIKCCKLVH